LELSSTVRIEGAAVAKSTALSETLSASLKRILVEERNGNVGALRQIADIRKKAPSEIWGQFGTRLEIWPSWLDWSKVGKFWGKG
jgi:hypothetical protein